MLAERVRARCARSGPSDSQPVAIDTSTPSLLLTCKRVLQCGSVWVASEARTRAACVTSVLCTRVLVWKAQGSECERGGGEAEAGKPVRDNSKSGNREIGKSGNRETASRAYDFLREAWCSCDAAAAECQDCPLPSTRSPVLASCTRTAAIYKAVVVLSQEFTKTQKLVVGVESG